MVMLVVVMMTGEAYDCNVDQDYDNEVKISTARRVDIVMLVVVTVISEVVMTIKW